MKILVIGHGRHGKDTVAAMLAEQLECDFRSSSDFANERCVFPVLKERYGYETLEECYEDRINHRQEWKDLIAAYCQPPERLTQELLQEADIYVGLRRREEFNGARKLFDFVVWVDACQRLPVEVENELTLDDSDYVIGNNDGLDELQERVEDLVRLIRLGGSA